MMQGLSTSSNNGDEWDPVVDRNIMMEKNRELKKSKYIHSTLVDGTGIIIQFINSQGAFAQGAGEVFGGVRINLSDPEKVPNYIDKYESTIRSHARIQLEEHLNRANHPGGLHETLSDEDFGLTIAWGTLSSIGRKASPSSRGEGPIWYGIYPTLIEPINVSRDPSQQQDWTHVLNCYVNLATNKEDAVISVSCHLLTTKTKTQARWPPSDKTKIEITLHRSEEVEEDTPTKVSSNAHARRTRGTRLTRRRGSSRSSRPRSRSTTRSMPRSACFQVCRLQPEIRLRNGKREVYLNSRTTKK